MGVFAYNRFLSFIIEAYPYFPRHVADCGYIDVGGGIPEHVDEPFLGCVLVNVRHKPFAVSDELQQTAYLLGYFMQVAHTPLVRFFILNPKAEGVELEYLHIVRYDALAAYRGEPCTLLSKLLNPLGYLGVIHQQRR